MISWFINSMTSPTILGIMTIVCIYILYMYVHKHTCIYLIFKYYEVKDKQVLYYIIELSVRKMEKNNVSYTCTGRCFTNCVLVEPFFICRNLSPWRPYIILISNQKLIINLSSNWKVKSRTHRITYIENTQ